MSAVDLVMAMHELQDEFGLDTVSVCQKLPDGHLLTLTMTDGAPLVIERDDGHMLAVPEDDE
jgi:hypothetical protein